MELVSDGKLSDSSEVEVSESLVVRVSVGDKMVGKNGSGLGFNRMTDDWEALGEV